MKDTDSSTVKSNWVKMMEKRIDEQSYDIEKHQKNVASRKKNDELKIKQKNELVDKYNNRIRNFTLEMIDKPIKINNIPYQCETTRAQYLEETSNKILGNKGFIFSNYITEKDRLNKLHDEKIQEQSRFETLRDQQMSKPNIDEKVLIGLIQQPQMRFKPRTQLERIVENLNYDNRISNNEKNYIINRSINNINNASKDLTHKQKVQLITAENLHLFNKESVQGSIERGKLRASNKEAKKVLKYLHYKTHFKGAASINFSKYLQQMPTLTSTSNQQNLKKKKQIEQGFVASSKIAKDDVFFPISQNDFYTQEDNDDETEFKLNYNPLVKFEENVVDYTKLRKAKNLYMSSTPHENDEDNNRKSGYPSLVRKLVRNNKMKKRLSKHIYKINETQEENKKDDEKIFIDSEAISKDDMDKIALRILHKCDYFHKKNKNNNTTHEAREGKTAITNGLTIKEFEKLKGLDYSYKILKWK
jgi:hypothetical protein